MMTTISSMFSGCMLPVSTNLNKTFLQIGRENDQARIEQFSLPIERSVLRETSEVMSKSGDMSDIWSPWENYSPDTQFIEEGSSVASIEETLKKFEKSSVEDLETNSIVPHCVEVKEKMVQLELEFSSDQRKLRIYDDSQPTIPGRPNVLNGELFPPCLGMKMEDIMKPEARRLLDQLDNPDKFLSNLPPLPLPEWSNNVKRDGMVMEKMKADEGHVVMQGKENADLNLFCTDFEEFVQQSMAVLYQTDLTVERDMWNLFKVEGLILDYDKVVHENKEKEDDLFSDSLAIMFDPPSPIIGRRSRHRVENERAQDFNNYSLLKEFDSEDVNIYAGVRKSEVTESKTVVAAILDHIITSMFCLLDSENVRRRSPCFYTWSSTAETFSTNPSFRGSENQQTPTSSVNTTPESNNNLPPLEGLSEDIVVQKSRTVVASILDHIVKSVFSLLDSENERKLSPCLYTRSSTAETIITIPPFKGPENQLTPTSSVNKTPELNNNLPTLPVLVDTIQPVTPMGISISRDLNPTICLPPEANIPQTQEKIHSQANNSQRLHPTILEHIKVVSSPISQDTRDGDKNHLYVESASPPCESPLFSASSSQLNFVPSLSSSLQESRSRRQTTPCNGSSTILLPDYCPPYKGTTMTLESDISFMSSSATSSAESETILLDFPPLLLSQPSTVSPSPHPATPLSSKKQSPLITPDSARPSPCCNPASPEPKLSPCIANQPLLNAEPLPLSRRTSAQEPCSLVEPQLLEPVIHPCNEVHSTTATISTQKNQKIITEAEASIKEATAPIPTYTSKIPAQVKSDVPLKCFLLPHKEDWSIYVKKLVVELLYVPRTVKCRQVVRECRVEDVKQCSPVMTNQSRISLLQKLKTVTVNGPSSQDNAGIHAESIPYVNSFKAPLKNDLPTMNPTCSSSSQSVETALITMASSEIEGTNVPINHPRPPLSHPVFVQGQFGQDEVFLTELEHKHGMVVHDIDESDNLPHILVGPTEGIFVFWPGAVMPTKSPEACFASSCQILQKVWFVSVQQLDIYIECCKLSYASSQAGTGCKLMSALVEDRYQLAQLIADIVHTEDRNAPSYKMCENSSRHQKLLLNVFPCLNPYSVKVILSRVSLLQFLSLDMVSIARMFPWLPENSTAAIADVNRTTFQLSQFVNPNQVEQFGNAVACDLTHRRLKDDVRMRW